MAGDKPDDCHMGHGTGAPGKEHNAALEQWSKGTSQSAWNCDIPTSLETPDHLAVFVPLATQQLIWNGGYVNIANFIPQEEGEELTSKLKWVDGALVKQTPPNKSSPYLIGLQLSLGLWGFTSSIIPENP